MLSHVPQLSRLSQEFTISEGETLLTELEITPSQYSGAWTLGLERWEVYGDPGWLGLTREYYLEANGEIKGRAHKSGFLSATHVVRFEGQTYTLEKESVFLRQFTLREGGRSLGAIYPELPVKIKRGGRITRGHARAPQNFPHLPGASVVVRGAGWHREIVTCRRRNATI